MADTADPTSVRPNENERRADDAMAAIEAATGREFRADDVEGLATDITDLLAHLRHLCDRYDLDYAALDRRAYRHYVAEHADGPVARREHPTPLAPASDSAPLDAEVIQVQSADHRAHPSVHRACVMDLCGELLSDPDLLTPMWSALIATLLSGSAAEDEQEMPRRFFAVADQDKPTLARQLLAVREQVLGSAGELAADDLPEPDGGLAVYLP
jgi:hypothetical protein